MSPPIAPRIRIRIAAVVAVFAAIAACARGPACYETQFVTIDKVDTVRPNCIEVVYHTLAETMFHSPGVNLSRAGDALEFRVLRAFYEDVGEPDVMGTAAAPYQRKVAIDLAGARELVLTDGKVSRRVWPAPSE